MAGHCLEQSVEGLVLLALHLAGQLLQLHLHLLHLLKLDVKQHATHCPVPPTVPQLQVAPRRTNRQREQVNHYHRQRLYQVPHAE